MSRICTISILIICINSIYFQNSNVYCYYERKFQYLTQRIEINLINTQFTTINIKGPYNSATVNILKCQCRLLKSFNISFAVHTVSSCYISYSSLYFMYFLAKITNHQLSEQLIIGLFYKNVNSIDFSGICCVKCV